MLDVSLTSNIGIGLLTTKATVCRPSGKLDCSRLHRSAAATGPCSPRRSRAAPSAPPLPLPVGAPHSAWRPHTACGERHLTVPKRYPCYRLQAQRSSNSGGGGRSEREDVARALEAAAAAAGRRPSGSGNGTALSPLAGPGPGEEAVAAAGGYIVPGENDGWTWDDDYNPRVLANAALAAREPAPSPRAATAAARAAAARRAPTVITRLPEHLAREVISNGVLLVDKPLDWTALDVVNSVKPAVKARRAGFAGSLDPGATGLLIICLGNAAALAPRFTALPRTYSGTIRLGVTTTTDDATGAVTSELPWQHVTDADLAAAARGLTGEIMQLPHMWSGTKVNGRPLRWYAERGQSAPRTPRAVLIESLDLWRDGGPDSPVIGFRTVTAKGANVRALIADLGAALGCGAHVASLRREAIGGFSVDKAWTLDVFIPMAKRFGRAFRAGPPGGLDGGGSSGGGGSAAAAVLPAGGSGSGGGGGAGLLPRPPQ